jgi:hypothetical protein
MSDDYPAWTQENADAWPATTDGGYLDPDTRTYIRLACPIDMTTLRLIEETGVGDPETWRASIHCMATPQHVWEYSMTDMVLIS